MTFIYTQDGSPTIYDWNTGEHHHNLIGAYRESLEKYINLSTQILNQEQSINILDLPFGIGYNFATVLKYLENHNIQDKTIHCTGIEKDINILKQIEYYPSNHELKRIFNTIHSLYKNSENNQSNISLDIYNADLRDILPELIQAQSIYNLIYYDPFSPRSMPELWNHTILSQLAQLLDKQSGLFITYTSSNKVRRNLVDLGLHIAPTISLSWTQNRQGTMASYNKDLLNNQEFSEEILIKISKSAGYV